MDVSSDEYQGHSVFEVLDDFDQFYGHLALSVMPFTSQGTRALANIDTYVLSSIQGTIDSVRTVLRNGRINDAYALLRKYYDSAVMNVYINLYLEDHFNLECPLVSRIDDWMQGSAKLPEYDVMRKYVSKSPRLTHITEELFERDDCYIRIRRRCNDHTHYNFFRLALYNDNEVHLPKRIHHLSQLQADVVAIFAMHFVMLMAIEPHYMIARDHLDCLECGTQPPEGSEHWVAPFVQEIFSRYVAVHRPEAARRLVAGTSMELELPVAAAEN